VLALLGALGAASSQAQDKTRQDMALIRYLRLQFYNNIPVRIPSGAEGGLVQFWTYGVYTALRITAFLGLFVSKRILK
jgi:hypothetical protein